MKGKLFLSALTAAMLALPSALWAQGTSTLDTVVVTATRAEESKREVTANVTVIDSKTIQNSTANNMSQLLSQQGFQVTNQGTQKVLKIRGMGQRSMGTEMTSEVLVLLNGRRIGANNVALMGLDNIDRIEIIRGPSAVQYGPSAMGGVVNIITRRGTEDIQASLEAGLGSYGLHKEIMSFSGARDGFDFSAGATQMGIDDYDVKGGDKWEHTSIDSSFTGNMDMGYTFFENHRLGLNLNYYEQKGAESPSSGWSNTGEINQNANYNDYDLLRNYNLALGYEGGTEDGAFNWMARYSFGQDASQGNRVNSLYGNSWFDDVLKNNAVTAQVGYDSGILAVMLGFDYIKYNYDQKGTYTNNESKYEDTAGYLSAKLRLFDERFIISAGGRYDSYKISAQSMLEDRNDNNFTPSAGLAFLPVEWLKLRGNYSEGFRMPSPEQMVGSYQTIPNYDLQPDKSKTFEFGVDVAWEYIDAGLTYFHTAWDNKILGVRLPGGMWQNQNIDGATIAGFEFSFRADLGQAFEQDFELTPYVNLTWLTTHKNKDPESVASVGSDTLLNTPKVTVAYGLTFSHPEYDFMANINASYYDSVLTADYTRTAPQWPAPTQYVDTKSGTVVDLSLEKGLFDFNDYGKLKLRAEVNNLFDDWNNGSYLDYPGPGRNFYMGLRYDY